MNPPAKPLVTIAIPVFNGEFEISDAIESVFNQSIDDFELVVIDDCSTDKTIEVVESFKDQRIRLIKNEVNLGYIGNFNRAVNEARGEYLKILCHDDIILPNSVEALLRPFKEPNDRVVLSTGLKKIVNNRRKSILRPQGFNGKSREIDGVDAIRACVRAGRNLIGETSVALVRTSVIREIGTFKTKYTLDLNMWFRILQTGNVYFVNEPVSEFRVTNSSGTAAQSRTQAKQTRELIDWIKQEDIGVSNFDAFIGKLSASVNQFARRAIFFFAN